MHLFPFIILFYFKLIMVGMHQPRVFIRYCIAIFRFAQDGELFLNVIFTALLLKICEGPTMHDIRSIRTWSIVPVDLNAFMCINMRILASFYEIYGNFKKKSEYYRRYQNMKIALKRLHWNETDGLKFKR